MSFPLPWRKLHKIPWEFFNFITMREQKINTYIYGGKKKHAFHQLVAIVNSMSTRSFLRFVIDSQCFLFINLFISILKTLWGAGARFDCSITMHVYSRTLAMAGKCTQFCRVEMSNCLSNPSVFCCFVFLRILPHKVRSWRTIALSCGFASRDIIVTQEK